MRFPSGTLRAGGGGGEGASQCVQYRDSPGLCRVVNILMLFKLTVYAPHKGKKRFELPYYMTVSVRCQQYLPVFVDVT